MSSLRVARESARGSLIIFVGNVLSTFLAAAAAIIVARLLGPDGYGLYTLALVGPLVFVQFLGLGVNLAITRFVAFHLSKGEVDRAIEVTKRGTMFLLLTGVILALASYFAAPYVAAVLLKRATLTPYVQLASIFLLAQAATQASSSAFVGWSMMGTYSLFSIVQAILKLIVSPVLILVGFGVYGAVIGHVTSYIVQGGAALLALYALKLRSPSKTTVGFVEDIKSMIGYGLPAFAGGIMTGLASQYVTILIATVAANTVVGYYQAAINVTVAISVVSTAPTIVLFRSFAALDGLKANMSQAFDYAVRFVSFMLTPVVFFLIATSGLFFGVLYGPFYSGGVILLELASISYLPVAFGLPVYTPFLNGTGNSRLTLFVNIAGSVTLVLASLLLGVWLGLGVEGIIYALLVGNATAAGLGVLFSVRYLHVQVTLSPLLRIVIAATVGLIVVLALPHILVSQVIMLLLDAVVFAFVYLSCVSLFRGISISDLDTLYASLEGIRLVRPVVRVIFAYEKWILVRSGAH